MSNYTGMMSEKTINDRIATGDDKYILTQLDDNLWRIKLTSSPDGVTQEGTLVNKALLQELYDRIRILWNYVYMNETTEFTYALTTLDTLNVEGLWNQTGGTLST